MTEETLNPADSEMLLTLVVGPALSDAVIDWLLVQDDLRGFSSHHGAGHGQDPNSLSATEQVAGRQARVFFNLMLPAARFPDVLARLRAAFSGADLHYWAVPVIHSGHLEPMGKDRGG
ncbi:DUF3240 family protein [Candidatus Macondimonas diazotrophica]|jgi:hypothetical protein|uniref:DUF3240 domain-containing protein n=1 Tax=Candidatus Macondimonas diazotrophica TaxID=2305248 RepID=A0A4Z0FAV9_9GAMM|nr:DUF3240 family protein [Candidatus Macondimonas diazotrophica]NCU01106.1 DUF3240 domain-containing protein [Candidatus Macondimonas diazotrophica]TFZ82825.1 DUF3240 domain-containing protein [Candidatus Macondimonas diazotrophica]HBG31165.1 DUF3240 domain-containing protein [Gammaproteobacteria bacterium]HBG52157.1 DUF3240 domain-containing protein [Gammaproteobacteria bacterium]